MTKKEYPPHKSYYKDPYGKLVEVCIVSKAGFPSVDRFYLCRNMETNALVNIHETLLITTKGDESK
jgi:hypothetical protein